MGDSEVICISSDEEVCIQLFLELKQPHIIWFRLNIKVYLFAYRALVDFSFVTLTFVSCGHYYADVRRGIDFDKLLKRFEFLKV